MNITSTRISHAPCTHGERTEKMRKNDWMILGIVAAMALAPAFVQAADITLTASDATGTSSFTAAGHWSNSAAPSSGNDYFVAGNRVLRTPNNTSNNYTFAGNSLTLGDGTDKGTLFYKGRGSTITVDDLRLNTGVVTNSADSGSSGLLTLAGSITVSGTGNYLSENGAYCGGIYLTANVSGSGDFGAQSANYKGSSVRIHLQGQNTYTGNTNIIDTGTKLYLDAAGSLQMVVNSVGASSQILATGTAGDRNLYMDGTLKLNVAGVTGAGSWTLVNPTDLTTTYGATFAVKLADGTSFAESSDVWTLTQGSTTYTFTEATGVLSVVIPEPATLAVLLAGGAMTLLRRRR